MSNFQNYLTNADYISGYNAIREHDISARDMGMVYVEDGSDVMFWRAFIEEYFPKRYRFQTASNGVTGKRALEKLYDNANIQALIAVDSDYDYIKAKFDNNHPFNTNPYILHTVAFCRESALVEKNSLQDFLQKCQYTVSHNIDLITFINQFSKLAWYGLIRFITANYNDNYQSYTENNFHQCFNITDKQLISENLTLDNSTLATVKDNLKNLFQNNNFTKDDVNTTKEILTALAINQDNAYRFICGHTLEDLIKKIYKDLLDTLYKKEIVSIQEQFESNKIKSRIKQLKNNFNLKFSLETFFTLYPINENDEIHQTILKKVKLLNQINQP